MCVCNQSSMVSAGIDRALGDRGGLPQGTAGSILKYLEYYFVLCQVHCPPSYRDTWPLMITVLWTCKPFTSALPLHTYTSYSGTRVSLELMFSGCG